MRKKTERNGRSRNAGRRTAGIQHRRRDDHSCRRRARGRSALCLVCPNKNSPHTVRAVACYGEREQHCYHSRMLQSSDKPGEGPDGLRLARLIFLYGDFRSALPPYGDYTPRCPLAICLDSKRPFPKWSAAPICISARFGRSSRPWEGNWISAPSFRVALSASTNLRRFAGPPGPDVPLLALNPDRRIPLRGTPQA